MIPIVGSRVKIVCMDCGKRHMRVRGVEWDGYEQLYYIDLKCRCGLQYGYDYASLMRYGTRDRKIDIKTARESRRARYSHRPF